MPGALRAKVGDFAGDPDEPHMFFEQAPNLTGQFGNRQKFASLFFGKQLTAEIPLRCGWFRHLFIFVKEEDHLEDPRGNGSELRSMRSARPDDSSISTTAPCKKMRSLATSNFWGMLVRNRSTMGSISRPITLSCGPVNPASQRKAVPPGKICSSAVWTWV